MAKRKGNKKLKVKIEKKTSEPKNNAVIESSADAEKKKLLLMRAGVACFMIIFFAAWIFNLKYQFKINSNNLGNKDKSSFNWEQAKAELDKAMGQVKEGLAQIKQAREQAQSTLPVSSELTNQRIDLLKEKLMSETATGTAASSTIK